MGSASLFGILVSASKIFDNSLIDLSWESPLEKVILAWVFLRTLPDLQHHEWPYILNCS